MESRLRGIFEKRGKVSKVTHVKAKGVAYVEFAEFKEAIEAIFEDGFGVLRILYLQK